MSTRQKWHEDRTINGVKYSWFDSGDSGWLPYLVGHDYRPLLEHVRMANAQPQRPAAAPPRPAAAARPAGAPAPRPAPPLTRPAAGPQTAPARQAPPRAGPPAARGAPAGATMADRAAQMQARWDANKEESKKVPGETTAPYGKHLCRLFKASYIEGHGDKSDWYRLEFRVIDGDPAAVGKVCVVKGSLDTDERFIYFMRDLRKLGVDVDSLQWANVKSELAALEKRAPFAKCTVAPSKKDDAYTNVYLDKFETGDAYPTSGQPAAPARPNAPQRMAPGRPAAAPPPQAAVEETVEYDENGNNPESADFLARTAESVAGAGEEEAVEEEAIPDPEEPVAESEEAVEEVAEVEEAPVEEAESFTEGQPVQFETGGQRQTGVVVRVVDENTLHVRFDANKKVFALNIVNNKVTGLVG
jgi:hypothetical protein